MTLVLPEGFKFVDKKELEAEKIETFNRLLKAFEKFRDETIDNRTNQEFIEELQAEAEDVFPMFGWLVEYLGHWSYGTDLSPRNPLI